MNAPVCVYDSGIGGLSIWREIAGQLPSENLLYLADQANVPYGDKSPEELLSFARAVTRFFLSQNAKLVVFACNSVSAAALHQMRREFPQIGFVGMEPAVKPAASETRTGKVGVIATTATIRGELYRSVVDRFASGVEVYHQACPGLADMIERGEIGGQLERALEGWLRPLLDKGIDRLVLACTHYPLVGDRIRAITGEGVILIDPAPAIARQVGRMLAAAAPAGFKGTTRFLTTSANLNRFREQVGLYAVESPITAQVRWNEKNEISTDI